MTIPVSLVINGKTQAFDVGAHHVVADVLRERFGLTGCKVGCDQGVCGACTVLVDGAPVTGCATFMFAVDGREVTTIEGLGLDGALSPVQQAFLAAGAFQCGFCTAGMILSVTALLLRDPDPDEATIRQWLAGNICRCTGYNAIVEAVRRAARQEAEAS